MEDLSTGIGRNCFTIKYRTAHAFQVALNGNKSTPKTTNAGIPQG